MFCNNCSPEVCKVYTGFFEEIFLEFMATKDKVQIVFLNDDDESEDSFENIMITKRKKMYDNSSYFKPKKWKPLTVDEFFEVQELVSYPIVQFDSITEYCNEESTCEGIPLISLRDLQMLILSNTWDLKVKKNIFLFPSWCKISKQEKVSHIVVTVVHGITAKDFEENPECFPHIKRIFSWSVNVKPTSSGSFYEELYIVPVTSNCFKMKLFEKFQILRQASSDDILKFLSENGFIIGTPTEPSLERRIDDSTCKKELLLSLSDMQRLDFPCQENDKDMKYGKYINTKNYYKPVSDSSPMFAIDCEVNDSKELHLVAIVNEASEVVYYACLTNQNKKRKKYRVTRDDLKERTLAEVQEDLQNLLPPDAILCGHSINNDLHLLRIIHPYVIDTSVIYNLTGDEDVCVRLKTLAKLFLHRRIQKKFPHDPIEDSVATMDLVKLKLKKGLKFGDVKKNFFLDSEDVVGKDEIRKLIFRTPFSISLFYHLKNLNKDSLLVDRQSRLAHFEKETFTKIGCRKNKEIVACVQEKCSDYYMTFTHLDRSKLKFGKSESNEKQKLTFSKIDTLVENIYEKIKNGGLNIIIFSDFNSINTRRRKENGICFIGCKYPKHLDKYLSV